MKHPKVSLLGATAGLMAGLMLTPASITARRSSTRLTWDGSNCPAGTYTITSTATNLANAQTYFASMTGVALPSTTVVQDFSNLPGGSYSVIASLASNNGLSFASQPQTVTAQDGKSAPAAPTISSSASGRRRPAAAPVIGIAQPRETPPPPIGYDAGSPRAAGKTIASMAPDPAPQAVTAARAALLESVLRMLAASDPTATLVKGDAVKTIDTDADGIVDLIGVTIGGEVWFLRIAK